MTRVSIGKRSNIVDKRGALLVKLKAERATKSKIPIAITNEEIIES